MKRVALLAGALIVVGTFVASRSSAVEPLSVRRSILGLTITGKPVAVPARRYGEGAWYNHSNGYRFNYRRPHYATAYYAGAVSGHLGPAYYRFPVGR